MARWPLKPSLSLGMVVGFWGYNTKVEKIVDI